jgi:hypothetical protein
MNRLSGDKQILELLKATADPKVRQQPVADWGCFRGARHV